MFICCSTKSCSYLSTHTMDLTLCSQCHAESVFVFVFLKHVKEAFWNKWNYKPIATKKKLTVFLNVQQEFSSVSFSLCVSMVTCDGKDRKVDPEEFLVWKVLPFLICREKRRYWRNTNRKASQTNSSTDALENTIPRWRQKIKSSRGSPSKDRLVTSQMICAQFDSFSCTKRKK